MLNSNLRSAASLSITVMQHGGAGVETGMNDGYVDEVAHEETPLLAEHSAPRAQAGAAYGSRDLFDGASSNVISECVRAVAQHADTVGADCSGNIRTAVGVFLRLIARVGVSAIIMWGATVELLRFMFAAACVEKNISRETCDEEKIPQYDATFYFATSAFLYCVYYAYRGVRACLARCCVARTELPR